MAASVAIDNVSGMFYKPFEDHRPGADWPNRRAGLRLIAQKLSKSGLIAVQQKLHWLRKQKKL